MAYEPVVGLLGMNGVKTRVCWRAGWLLASYRVLYSVQLFNPPDPISVSDLGMKRVWEKGAEREENILTRKTWSERKMEKIIQ